jgi:indoleamine 2,3-dioxygenase
VRPYLAGWPEPGVVYVGVDERPRVLAGGSAAQSTLVQALDAGLSVQHTDPSTTAFLNGMRAYMPRAHRAFLADLEAGPDVRHYVRQCYGLVGIYDRCVTALSDFRSAHLRITARYILRQEPRTPTASARGTGGTSFVPMLRRAREETRRAHLAPSPRGGAPEMGSATR